MNYLKSKAAVPSCLSGLLLNLVCFTRRISTSIRLCPFCFVLCRCRSILRSEKERREKEKRDAFQIQNSPHHHFLLHPAWKNYSPFLGWRDPPGVEMATQHTQPASLTQTKPHLGQEKEASMMCLQAAAKVPTGQGFLRAAWFIGCSVLPPCKTCAVFP